MTQSVLSLNNQQKTKIAVFRALKLGDLLVSIPAIRALRKAYPCAEITLISLPWAKEFVEYYPVLFDRFIAFSGYPGLPEQPVNPERTIDFLKHMQGERFDLVLQMQGNGTIVNPMIELFGAKMTAGYYPKSLPQYQLNDRYMPYPENECELIRHIKLLEFLGIQDDGYEMEFPITEEDQKNFVALADRYKLNPKQYICIHPGGISGGRWPEKEFAKIADFLSDLGYQIVLTGTEQEKSIVEMVIKHMKQKPVSLIGKTDLGTLAAVLKYSTLLTSNDTGVSHLAAAVKTPSVIIFIKSDPAIWAPLDTTLHHALIAKNLSDFRVVALDAVSLLKQHAKPISLLKGAQL